MSISSENFIEVVAVNVWFTDHKLCVRLNDGREIGVPVEWFPRLKDAEQQKLLKWTLIGGGIGVYWPDLDEDISVESLLQPHAYPLVYKE